MLSLQRVEKEMFNKCGTINTFRKRSGCKGSSIPIYFHHRLILHTNVGTAGVFKSPYIIINRFISQTCNFKIELMENVSLFIQLRNVIILHPDNTNKTQQEKSRPFAPI